MAGSVTVHTAFGMPEVQTIDNVKEIVVEPGGFLNLKRSGGGTAGLFAPGSWRAAIPIRQPTEEEG
jgi:hypothetical protein